MADILRTLSWYLVISVIGLVGTPIIFRFLPHLTSRGYALARPLGLLIWGYLFWLLGSLGILQNDLGGVMVAFSLLLAVSIWSCSKGQWREMIVWLRENKKTVLTMETLFLAAFVLWAVVRAANPDVVYTEKPMELAFINSILKSPSMPPQDPWMSGYAISYYYFGYVLISMLIRVTGVASSISFNLSAALWFALTALAVYGIVFDLLAARKHNPDHQNRDILKPARMGGFLGPLYVLIISCLEGVFEFLYSWGAFWKMDPQGNLVSRFWSWLAISELDTAPTQPASFFPSRPASWLWWRGSRVIQDLTLTNTKLEVIDEFPFFSYLLADLHPHLLAMPFGLLAVGICLNLLLSKNTTFTNGSSVFTWFKHWDFWLIALALGSMAFINIWDFPIYVGLFCLVILFARVREKGWNWSRIWEFIKSGLVIGITGVVLFSPFYLGFSSQAGGILPSMEYSTRGIHFWILFGALLVPIVTWLFIQLRKMEKPRELIKGLKLAVILFSLLFLASLLFGLLIMKIDLLANVLLGSTSPLIVTWGAKLQAAYQAFTVWHGTSDAGVLLSQSLIRRLASPGTWITLILMLAAVWTLLFTKKNGQVSQSGNTALIEEGDNHTTIPARYFVYLLILVGVVLTAFPEFFYLRDQFGTRMNTIFKFYFQAWILWGIVAAYASVELITQLKGIKSYLFNAFWMITILGGLAYPCIMLLQKTNRFNPTQWTLDGNAYLATYYQDDYAAIRWLSQEPLGVVAEAIGGSYSEYARVSTRTGMPTVLGWPGHEGQWRGEYTEVKPREADIKLLYTSRNWDEISAIIQRYNIRYVYVGGLEKDLYHAESETFKAHLPVVYENGNVSIFEVPSSEGEITP